MKTPIAMHSILAAAPILLVVGCATPPKTVHLNQEATVFSREDMMRMKQIALPPNYSTENFRKIQMGVSFQSVNGFETVVTKDGPKRRAMAVSPDLSSKLQTEMAKLKRFTIFSAHNRGGVTAFQELQDVDGEVTLKEAGDVKDIDIILSGSVTVTKEKQKRYNDIVVIYEVECNFSCEDLKTRTVKFAETVKGATSRVQMVSYTGRITSGFDDTNPENEKQAIEQAAKHALALIANKLGNTYPVGGAVTGCSPSGDRMTLNKGFEQGIGADQQCVVYVDDDGVDIPLACAEAAPKADGTSQLTIYRWNDGDRDAKPLLKLYRESPKQFVRDNKLYAVGYGMPVPPAWQTQDNSSEAARNAYE